MWGVLGWCGLVEEVDVVDAVGGEVDGAGSGLGGDSVCVCEVLVDGGEAGGDDDGSMFLLFDVEVVVVAADEEV